MKNNKKTLLPEGFADVLPPEAAFETSIVGKLLGNFAAFGYEQVKAPLVEYESTLLADKAERLGSQTFRLKDGMALRADITMQIARIAATRLAGEPKPLRLSYAGQVCRAKGEGLYKERQFAQAGIELIGTDSLEADAEAITIAVTALKNLGVKNISVDFSLPLLSGIIMAGNKGKFARNSLLEAIERKDADGIKKSKLQEDIKDTILDLLKAAGSVKNSFARLQKVSLPPEGEKLTRRLQDLTQKLADSGLDAALTIDLLERRGFEYHTGISFAIFCRDSAGEIGRGGRYKIGDDDAVGFTISVNTLQRTLPKPKPGAKIYLPFGTPTTIRQKLQKQGKITICGLEKEKNPKAQARKLGCSALYDGKKIVNLK